MTTSDDNEFREITQDNINDDFKEIFSLFDKDGDGTILKIDAIDCLKALEIDMTDEAVNEINNFLKECPNKIQKEQFMYLYNCLLKTKKSKKEEEIELESALSVFTNDDGDYIDANLFINSISTFGYKIQQDKIKEILTHVSWNEDNTKFSASELLNYLLYEK